MLRPARIGAPSRRRRPAEQLRAGACRPRALAADPREPHPQCREVHRAWRTHRGGGARRERRGHDRGARQRHRHRARQAAAGLGAVRSGRRLARANAQGPGDRPCAREGPRAAPWRQGRGLERRIGARQHVPGALATRRGRRSARRSRACPGARAGEAGGSARSHRRRQCRRGRDARDDAGDPGTGDAAGA